MNEVSNFGISFIDANYINKGIVSIYIIKQGTQATIIETGTKHNIHLIKNQLDNLGLGFDDVRYIIPTHVHLDHAAGAGFLIKNCPNADLIIHPRGARHMVDPSKLIEGVKAVYGDSQFKKLYGDILPIPEGRIITANDGFEVDFNGRMLQFLDTPGHARHHFCIYDSLSEYIFTGDTFGISYREFDIKDNIFIFPTTTPVQFDPKALIESIDKIISKMPKAICLTHFGIIKPTYQVVANLKQGVNFLADLGFKHFNKNNAKEIIMQEMFDYFLQKIYANGIKLPASFCKKKLSMDLELNAQGILFWQHQINK